MMRILYFSRDYSTHDHRFLSALAKSGHQIGYLRLERGPVQLEDRALPPEIEQIHWAGGRGQVSWPQAWRLIADLKRVIRAYKPDLIHAGPVQRAAFLVALAGYRPLVTASWGYDLLIDARRGRLWEMATRYTLRRSAALVGDCETIRQLAIRYGMRSDKIVTFPWGANLQKYQPPSGPKHSSSLRQRLGWGADTFVLLSTRSWTPLYGVEDLAHAFVEAARQLPELRLLMLGNGPLAPSIRRIFHQAGLLQQVHFPGQVSQGKLPEYYQAADLYISTSHSDGTSISLLEALACGTPVLLSDIPGNQEWITSPGEVGWLYADGNVSDLAAAILRAHSARAQLPVMGQAARLLAEERADWNKNFPQLFEAYTIASGGKLHE